MIVQRLLIALTAGVFLTGCSETALGPGSSSLNTSAAGPATSTPAEPRAPASNKTAAKPVQCAQPLGTIAMVEKPSPVLSQMGLTSPLPLLQVMIVQSGCFQVVDRDNMALIQQERAIAGKGTGNRGKLVSADYFLTPEVASQNSNSSEVGGGFGRLLPGALGSVAANLTEQSTEAQTTLVLTSAKTGMQVLAAVGNAKTSDIGLSLSRMGQRGVNANVGAYASTDAGKTVAAAFQDAYANLVQQMESKPKVARR